jgi:hypothetical protein
MSWFWKGLVVLLLALPVGAYVTGSLAGAPAGLPDRREPVVVQDPTADDTAPKPSRPGPGTADDRDDDRDDDRGDNSGKGKGGGGRDDGDDVEVVRPDPDDLDDESDDDGRDHDGDDNRDDRDDRDDDRDDVTDDG